MVADVEQKKWDASIISSGWPSPVKSCSVIAASVALNLPPSNLAHSLLAFWIISVAMLICLPAIAVEEKHRRTRLTYRMVLITKYSYSCMSPNGSRANTVKANDGASTMCPYT